MPTKNKTNVGGRPRGSRNKLNASDEIKKALNRGTGLVELKEFLWGMMQDPKVSEMQKAKFTQMYLDVMKYIHTENLKIENPKEDGSSKESKEIHEEENTDNTPAKSDKVARLSFGSK